jgi:hypothetical protein
MFTLSYISRLFSSHQSTKILCWHANLMPFVRRSFLCFCNRGENWISTRCVTVHSSFRNSEYGHQQLPVNNVTRPWLKQSNIKILQYSLNFTSYFHLKCIQNIIHYSCIIKNKSSVRFFIIFTNWHNSYVSCNLFKY